MGMWTNVNGKSVWREDLADTPQNQAAYGENRGSWDGYQTQQGPAGGSGGGGGGGGGGTSGSGNASNNYKVLTANMATPTTGRSFGMTNVGNSPKNDEYNRRHGIFDQRPNDNLQSYNERVFGQTLRNVGGSLSPDASNIFSDSPWARFYTNRYQNRAPLQYIIGRMLNPDQYAGMGAVDGGGEDATLGMQNYLQNFVQNGTGGGPIGDYRSTLGSIADIVNRVAGGNTDGLDPNQLGLAEEFATNPGMGSAAIAATMQDYTAPFAGGRMQRIMQSMADDYYENPMDNDPATAGPFFIRLLKQLGLAN